MTGLKHIAPPQNMQGSQKLALATEESAGMRTFLLCFSGHPNCAAQKQPVPEAGDCIHIRLAYGVRGAVGVCCVAAVASHLAHDGLIHISIALIIHAIFKRDIHAVTLASCMPHIIYCTCAWKVVTVPVEGYLLSGTAAKTAANPL